ncbi:hydroxyacylglutathione hydrolase [Aliiglaciecola sp. CAU 1673]|uniref:hydroxyacylglutathione hydrolase n=1 Tax=Aliiglaciecola sp. CAU 1673 TaxID=3032595 RepID=UPI0023D9F48B|nr:hydroxyacylglutathione hydrolase [Aliiglaciecola sp. CAU 1673]MDF2180268.1 hydroxyacylglutathione hydrolase [Aliiglaciecola sp. CAU 1673]
MIEITPIKALKDNYIWCLQKQGLCTLVDPGDDVPVLDYLSENKLQPTDILITHHHSDHIGGVENLLTRFPELNVWGVQSPRIPGVNRVISEDKKIYLESLDLEFDVIELPGHTLDHIGFYNHEVGLFCGDTLFSAGCGRLFEGTPAQMHASLSKLASLPKDTKVYCTHEYTLANIKFASTVEPDNKELQQYTHWAKTRREKDLPTLPSNIALEKTVNPFLRVHSNTIKNRVEEHMRATFHTPVEIFAALRGWKDQF